MNQVLRLLVIAALISVIILGVYYTYWVVPEKVEKTFIAALRNTGFENVEYENASLQNGKIVFSNITLDKNSFSKMQKAELHYSLLSYITKGQALKIVLEGLRLTGSMDQDWNFDISGQKNGEHFIAAIYQIPVQTIELKNSSIDVLTTQYGGIKLDYNALLRKQNDKIDLNAAIISAQKHLVAKGKVNGTLFPKGKADIKLDIQELQIERDNYTISRANAKGDLTIIPSSATYISAEIKAGAARFYDIPTKNLTIKYSKSGKDFTIDTSGKTIGKQELNFTSSLNHKKGEDTFSGNFDAEKSIDMVSFLIDNDIIPEDHNLPDVVLTSKQANISFKMESLLNENIYNGSFTFITKDPEFAVDGRFELDPNEGTITGTFAQPESKKNIKSLKNKNISAQMTLSSVGAFKLEQWKTQNSNFSWSFDLQTKNGEIDYGPITLKKVRGSLKFDSSKKKHDKQYLKYNLSLRNDIKHSGYISVNFGEKTEHALERFILNIYGGTLKTSKLKLQDNALPDTLTLHISDVNLDDFISDTNIKGIDIAGRIGGKLPIEFSGNKVIVKKGLLQSQNSGFISISKDLRDGLFPGRSRQMQLIRESLDNYFYEFFEIRLDGNLSGTIMMTLNARGTNPDLQDKTPVDLSLQIETDLSDLFSNLGN
ncbi:MAG: YdbH domain-containing protein [Alphaproteobacteria bacterium]|nr:YdbH domain-containing protein [Alphaproteobacteria bacterium]